MSQFERNLTSSYGIGSWFSININVYNVYMCDVCWQIGEKMLHVPWVLRTKTRHQSSGRRLLQMLCVVHSAEILVLHRDSAGTCVCWCASLKIELHELFLLPTPVPGSTCKHNQMMACRQLVSSCLAFSSFLEQKFGAQHMDNLLPKIPADLTLRQCDKS